MAVFRPNLGENISVFVYFLPTILKLTSVYVYIHTFLYLHEFSNEALAYPACIYSMYLFMLLYILCIIH